MAARKCVYLIGSLRNPEIVKAANMIEAATGYECFSSWYAAGPEADDKWREHEMARGRSYKEALAHYAAQHVFRFDKAHIDRADAVLLVMPAGKSGHLELGYGIGSGKPGFIMLDDPERWDVMYAFATAVTDDWNEIVSGLKRAVG